jgi:hypothetical protein
VAGEDSVVLGPGTFENTAVAWPRRDDEQILQHLACGRRDRAKPAPSAAGGALSGSLAGAAPQPVSDPRCPPEIEEDETEAIAERRQLVQQL